MRHVEKALKAMTPEITHEYMAHNFIKIENAKDIKGVAPVVSFTIQSDPINEVGINGCQASDMLEYVKNLIVSFNEAFPCRENELTIIKLEEALRWQEERTRDRQNRQVKGKNEK